MSARRKRRTTSAQGNTASSRNLSLCPQGRLPAEEWIFGLFRPPLWTPAGAVLVVSDKKFVLLRTTY